MFRIRQANISPSDRKHFEELGLEIVRAYFTSPRGVVVYRDERGTHTVEELHQAMQSWLGEQYDRVERKENFMMMMMEIAITVFVAFELFLSVLNFWSQHSK